MTKSAVARLLAGGAGAFTVAVVGAIVTGSYELLDLMNKMGDHQGYWRIFNHPRDMMGLLVMAGMIGAIVGAVMCLISIVLFYIIYFIIARLFWSSARWKHLLVSLGATLFFIFGIYFVRFAFISFGNIPLELTALAIVAPITLVVFWRVARLWEMAELDRSVRGMGPARWG